MPRHIKEQNTRTKNTLLPIPLKPEEEEGAIVYAICMYSLCLVCNSNSNVNLGEMNS